MSLTNSIKEKIAIEVIKTLLTRFENFPENASNNRNAPFHEAFLKAFSDKLKNSVSDVPFFISLASWLHGLNTTLGQTFFEKVSHILCDGEKREYTSKRLGNLQITKSQKNHITEIITNLSTSKNHPDLHFENSLVLQDYDTELVDAIDFSVDVFFEDADKVIAIELKSVKPNSGEMRGEKQKILEGKAALYRLFHGKDIHFYIGFPFDPTTNPEIDHVVSFNKNRLLDSIINMTKFFAYNETLVASELWNFLSGEENTMETILELINTIATTDFLSKFKLLQNNSKRDSQEYKKQLLEWNLFSELFLIDNNNAINQNLSQGSIKIYNKMLFDSKGNYNWDRYNVLKNLIENRQQ
jgi:hypothetical protein